MSADLQPPLTAQDSGVWQAKSVAEELETLFVRATGLPSGPPSPPALSARIRSVTPVAPERRVGRPAAVGALMAAGLVGLAVGVLLVSAQGPDRAAPTNRIAATVALPTAVLAVADPITIPTQEPLTIPAQEPGRLDTARVAKPRGPAFCGSAQCSHADLLAADRRLRKAYTRAISAGVPRAVLVNYRNRWASLRHDAVYRPNRVATGYSSMAGDLNRMADRRRAVRRAS